MKILLQRAAWAAGAVAFVLSSALWRGGGAGSLGPWLGAWALVAGSISLILRDTKARAAVRLASAALFGATFLVDVRSWTTCFLAWVFGVLFAALVPDWRERSTTRSRRAWEALWSFLPPLLLPALMFAAALSTGTIGTAWDTMVLALPPVPERALTGLASRVLVVVLLADGVRRERSRARGLEMLIVGGFACLALLRISSVLSLVTLPVETAWSEAPFLTNALKLAAGAELYGPPEALNSYTYSPLLDLVHRALLYPFGLALSLGAHRVLVLGEQALAITVLTWSLAPRLVGKQIPRALPWLVLALLTLVLSSLVAPAVHPDHAVLVCMACAAALLLREQDFPPRLFWSGILLVTPVAVSFKLSGAGIGLGLALAFAIERRVRALILLGFSGLLSAATIPLFDATLGRYRFYALQVQSSHPIEWHRWRDMVGGKFGYAVLLLATLVAVLRVAHRPAPWPREATRMLALSAGTLLFALPAYLKYAGRDNNLVAPFACLFTAALVAAAQTYGRAEQLHRLLLPAAVLGVVTPIASVALPLTGQARERVLAEARDLQSLASRSGPKTLFLQSTSATLSAQDTSVPVDRGQSAVELYFARNEAACTLFRHLEDGRYESVVVGFDFLAPRDDLLGRFNARLAESLSLFQTREPHESYVLFRDLTPAVRRGDRALSCFP